MLIKSFKPTEKKQLETYLAKFRRVFGYSPTVKLDVDGYDISIPDSKVDDYQKKHKMGLI